MMFHTIDALGFKVGEISPLAVSDHNRVAVVEDALPLVSLGILERWRWVEGQWVAVKDYRGHAWYNPTNTTQEHRAVTFDEAPPEGWLYWAPGENKVVLPAEQLETQWKAVKATRTRLLNESDWVVTKAMELGVLVAPEWLVYRQALRAITLQPDPFAISWPVKPE